MYNTLFNGLAIRGIMSIFRGIISNHHKNYWLRMQGYYFLRSYHTMNLKKYEGSFFGWKWKNTFYLVNDINTIYWICKKVI